MVPENQQNIRGEVIPVTPRRESQRFKCSNCKETCDFLKKYVSMGYCSARSSVSGHRGKFRESCQPYMNMYKLCPYFGLSLLLMGAILHPWHDIDLNSGAQGVRPSPIAARSVRCYIGRQGTRRIASLNK